MSDYSDFPFQCLTPDEALSLAAESRAMGDMDAVAALLAALREGRCQGVPYEALDTPAKELTC